jgi:hypothetical protein
MDALGVIAVSAGGFLLYAAVKGEHPWTLFQGVLGVAGTPTPVGTSATTGTTPGALGAGGGGSNPASKSVSTGTAN